MVQPHFPSISHLLINANQASNIALTVASECFRQPKDTLLRLTREYTLPQLVLAGKKKIIAQIAAASNSEVAVMLTDSVNASAILAFLFMQESPVERKKGLLNLVTELEERNVPIQELIQAVKVPLVYKLALHLGDEDPKVARQVRSEAPAKF